MKDAQLIDDLSKGIWNWYPFFKYAKVLFIGENDSPQAQALWEMGVDLNCITMDELLFTDIGVNKRNSFDYITGIRTLEQCIEREKLLRICKELLKVDGVLLLGEENRYGLRYFCGERDPYTGRSFDGIENYRTEGTGKICEDDTEYGRRLFARFELKKILNEAGFDNCKFFSVLSALEFPQMLYADDYLPEEELAIRYTPYYNNPDTLFLEETYLYDDLIQNGMFHQIANAYLIECPLNGCFSDIKHVTVSMDRGRERALTTIITGDGTVIKKAVYNEGHPCLQMLADNMQDLKVHGIGVVPGVLQKDCYVMPYINAENGVHYFRKLIFEDVQKFIEKVDQFWKCVLRSSEDTAAENIDLKKLNIPGVTSAEDIDLGRYYKRVYLDMVPLNCFVQDDEFIFFDQEFCMKDYPINVVLSRILGIIYQGDARMESVLPLSYFLKKYDLESHIDVYHSLDISFMADLRKRSLLADYNEKHREKGEVIYCNRQRINYSQLEYENLFINIFRNSEEKKIILFGSGKYATYFMEWFEDRVKIEKILDNNNLRWHQELNGVPVENPEYLRQLDPESYKVIICVKKYLPVMRQLKKLGAKYVSVYDAYIDYPGEWQNNCDSKKTDNFTQRALESGIEEKKYHVGYVSGVFDLFHIGHLNLLRRAKEQCEHLIVGVVTDEGVRKNKNRDPYVPFEERIEVVRSCKYVDEAVKIPLYGSGTRDAFRRYHFDCQFSGSDYENNAYWLAEQAYLRSKGSDLVFFPYTEQTSSTMLRKAISSRV